MKKSPARKLTLTIESLRILNPRALRAVHGGTVLVTVDDPITAPKTDTTTGGRVPQTEYTCLCISR